MTIWELTGGLGALTALIISIVAPILKLNTSITTLTCAMSDLKENLKLLTDNNTAGHTRLWEHIDKQDNTLADHETRISVIEDRCKGAE